MWHEQEMQLGKLHARVMLEYRNLHVINDSLSEADVLTSFLMKTIEVLYDTRVRSFLSWIRVFTLAHLPQTGYSLYNLEINFYEAEKSLFLFFFLF